MDENIEFPNIPEISEDVKINDMDLGVKDEDIKAIVEYVKGGNKPAFLDKLNADSNSRLMDFLATMSYIQLARIPYLTKYILAVQESLYSQQNLLGMDVKELSTASKNLTTEISNILETARRTQDSIATAGNSDSTYKSIMNQLMNLSEENLQKLATSIDQLSASQEGLTPEEPKE